MDYLVFNFVLNKEGINFVISLKKSEKHKIFLYTINLLRKILNERV